MEVQIQGEPADDEHRPVDHDPEAEIQHDPMQGVEDDADQEPSTWRSCRRYPAAQQQIRTPAPCSSRCTSRTRNARGGLKFRRSRMVRRERERPSQNASLAPACSHLAGAGCLAHHDNRLELQGVKMPQPFSLRPNSCANCPRNLTQPDAIVEVHENGEILRERDLGWDPNDYSTEPEDEDNVQNGLPSSIWTRERRRQKCLRILRARRSEPAAWDRPPKYRERRLRLLRREGMFGPGMPESNLSSAIPTNRRYLDNEVMALQDPRLGSLRERHLSFDVDEYSTASEDHREAARTVGGPPGIGDVRASKARRLRRWRAGRLGSKRKGRCSPPTSTTTTLAHEIIESECVCDQLCEKKIRRCGYFWSRHNPLD